jgi:DNA-binding transcriptional ArsR family regulator
MGNGAQTDAETLDELVELTRGPRASIIDGLRFYGGETNVKKLREYGDFQSAAYHLDILKEQELIEELGEEFVGRGGSSTVVRLTNLGQDVADELTDSSDQSATFSEMVERVEQLEDEIENFREAHNEMADFVEELDDEIDDLKQQ